MKIPLILTISCALASLSSTHANQNTLGAGEALRFIGNKSPFTQTIRTRVFPEGSFEEGITISMWFKASAPKSDYPLKVEGSGSAGVLFTVWPQVLGASIDTPWFLVSDYNTAAFQLDAIYKSDIQAFSLAQNDINPSWRHVVMSWNSRNGSLLLALDPGLESEAILTEVDVLEQEDIASALENPRRSAAFIAIGSGVSNDYDLSGELDDFCVLNQPVSKETAAQIGSLGCLHTAAVDPSHVLLHYSFDLRDGNDSPLFDDVLGRYSGLMHASVQDSTGDIYEFPFRSSREAGPLSMVSTAPLYRNAPTYIRPDITTRAFHVNITFDQATSSMAWLILQSIASTGTLCVRTDTLPGSSSDSNCTDTLNWRAVSMGTNISVSDVADWQGSHIWFEFMPWEDSVPGQRDSFELQVGFEDSSLTSVQARVVTNAPPMLLNSTTFIGEGEDRILYFPDKTQLVFDNEQSTGSLSFEILGLEGAVDAFSLYHCEDCGDNFLPDYYSPSDDYEELQKVWNHPILPSTLPYEIRPHERRVILVHDAESMVYGDDVFRIRYRAWDGLSYSNEALLSVSVPITNTPPRATEGSLNLVEDSEAVLIDLEGLLWDREGDNYTVEIEVFPSLGKLYQVSSTNWTPDAVEISDTSASPLLSQWVADVPENQASTCWDAEYCINALVGEPKQYPKPGDSFPTWQPENIDVEELWILVNFEKAVYAKEVSLFEVWSPGGTFKIEIENADQPGEWMTAWEGSTQQKSFCPELAESAQCAAIARYPLCPKSIRTRTLKIHLRMESSARWPAIDAVLLDGSEVPRGSLLVDSRSARGYNRLWYKPQANAFGPDVFGFAASDCPYYKVNRRLKGPDSRRASFNIAIEAQPDVPEVLTWQKPLLVPPSRGSGVVANLTIVDVDGIKSGQHRVSISPAKPFGHVSLAVLGVEEESIISNEMEEISAQKWTWVTNSKIDIPIRLEYQRCGSMEDETYRFQVEVSDGEHTVNEEYEITLQCGDISTELVRHSRGAAVAPLSWVLVSSGWLLVVICANWLIRRRSTRAVKLMSGLANLFIIFGSGFVYLYVFLVAKNGADFNSCKSISANLVLEESMNKIKAGIEHCPELGSGLCLPRLWFLVLGMASAISTLFVKAERVNTLFNNRKLRKIKFPASKLAKMVGAYCSVVLIVLLLFEVLSPQTYMADLGSPEFDADLQVKVIKVTEYCSSSQQSALQLVLVLVFGFMITRGAYLAYVTRKIEIREMNDSKEIGISIYNILVVGGISFALSSAITDPSAKFLATAVPVWLCTTIMLIVLFVPKILETEVRGDVGKTSVAPSVAFSTAVSPAQKNEAFGTQRDKDESTSTSFK